MEIRLLITSSPGTFTHQYNLTNCDDSLQQHFPVELIVIDTWAVRTHLNFL